MYKILIVDDEEMIRNGIRKIIPWAKIGIDHVMAAASGKEALEIIRQEIPQIMVTDICMVEMTGLDLIEKARELNPNMRIIVLTGYDDFKYAQRCCKLHVQDFILKPADEDELFASIKKQIHDLDQQKDMAKQQQLTNRIKGTAEQAELENCMRGFLTQNIPAENIEKFCGKYEWNPNQTMQAAVVLPTYAQKEPWEGYYDFLHLSVKSICFEVFDLNYEGITFEDKDGRIVIAVYTSSEFDESLERIKKLKDLLKTELEIQANAALGPVIHGFGQLNLSYQDALLLLKSTRPEEAGSIIQSKKSEQRLKNIYQKFLEHRKILSESTGDIDKLSEELNEFQKSMLGCNLSNSLSKRLCFEMASVLYYIYISSTGNSTDTKLNSLLNSLLLADRDSIFKFTKVFILQLFGQEEAGDTHELVTMAKKYIKDNLNKDITVTSIADSLYVNPSYFSRLFKRTAGEGCNEYIVRKRMEKAKSLLESTNEKTGKIADMVGYHDINYFSLAFKKNTGMSPTEYREKSANSRGNRESGK